MLASEDAAKAETHNRIERLCDPTHVRALPASEFDALFAAAALEVEARPGSTLDYEVGEWIEHGGPSEETATDIRRELEASIDPGSHRPSCAPRAGGLKMVYPQRVLRAIRQLSTS